VDEGVLKRACHLALLPFSAGGSLVFYGLSRLIDHVEPQDAMGWAAMCRTRDHVRPTIDRRLSSSTRIS